MKYPTHCKTEVLDCGHYPSPHESFTTGYGIDKHGKRHCYECCAAMDLKQMESDGRATLYYTGKEVTNWPGSLRFPVLNVRKGRHNIAGVRFDFWFTANGETWHGVQYGNMTQIAHCKRVKA